MDITVLTLEGFRQQMWDELRRFGTKNAMEYLEKGADPHESLGLWSPVFYYR